MLDCHPRRKEKQSVLENTVKMDQQDLPVTDKVRGKEEPRGLQSVPAKQVTVNTSTSTGGPGAAGSQGKDGSPEATVHLKEAAGDTPLSSPKGSTQRY